MEKDQKQNQKANRCPGCGSDQVILTEEKGSVPRCGGCGRPVAKGNNKSGK